MRLGRFSLTRPGMLIDSHQLLAGISPPMVRFQCAISVNKHLPMREVYRKGSLKTERSRRHCRREQGLDSRKDPGRFISGKAIGQANSPSSQRRSDEVIRPWMKRGTSAGGDRPRNDCRCARLRARQETHWSCSMSIFTRAQVRLQTKQKRGRRRIDHGAQHP
jgi:hypothetical protein